MENKALADPTSSTKTEILCTWELQEWDANVKLHIDHNGDGWQIPQPPGPFSHITVRDIYSGKTIENLPAGGIKLERGDLVKVTVEVIKGGLNE